ncbi:uncharacterized protein L3040_007340 [Drepanopeziza brunnea f. sp. 'multigermtubi']|uniref:Putative glutamyl-tRNA(Gln) amidotransferase subunit A n=1 Tax=Marssonina brunnea f. sp. multigermtubi (strain MB_m1) TaxID=1072389 RepID=K1XLD6_MARBU|nr:putative glutamyl-tRNA(Gln) amidotransferase subunit A [Drepanopeziza brunnea f. sp. 'multigermtubi' MB_m1]EKD13264.1 putative glutamyl-tRNA(Gln) amidotransferase subunit A [Drepanopeziza brunnea f. sp. 'multigermtubi' MB_m1]KAJ5037160.1 hypothetical protein L3040_007340 [Drepanopeziza brunnea f. sp. 'multigermtubi']
MDHSNTNSDSNSHSQPKFFGYPQPVQGPHTPYQKKDDANPVFRGPLLVIGAWIVSRLPFIQNLLWANAGFNCLRGLPYLKDYARRWDPTVIPIASGAEAGENVTKTKKLDSKSFPVPPEHLPGRYRTVAEYHALYLSGQLTPLAVVESLLPLIQRGIANPPPSRHATAFTYCNVDAVLEAAKASTLRYKQGAPLGILDGVPTGIKDDTDVAGYVSTYGRARNDEVFPTAEKSSWPVQMLQDAGAIVLGKLNMHEMGADTTNNNPNWGTPRNPHNDQYYTGGSSGGPAYAVSAGLVPLVVGTDGGGSIRIPASFCGVYGLKPSHNRLQDLGSTTTVNGPLAATISDLEIAYRTMAQPNPSDATCSLFPEVPTLPPSRPRVIGIYKEWFNRAEPSVLKLCNDVLAYYKEKLGYQIIDIAIPYAPEGQIAHAFTILCEMANVARAAPPNPSNWLHGLNAANQVLLAIAARTPAADYLLAQQLRNMLMQHLAFLYQQHPGLIIVTPTTPMPGWPIAAEGDLKYGITDGNTSIRNMEYVWLANFCGNPAISCPVGYVEPVQGEGRVPVGIMAMGEWGEELQLLGWGRECEAWLNEAYPGGRQRPGNWEDVLVHGKEKMVS